MVEKINGETEITDAVKDRDSFCESNNLLSKKVN